jgi:hypothetical protein
MASKATTVKYVKAISACDDSEIADVMSQIDDGDVKLLHDISRIVLSQLKTVHMEGWKRSMVRSRSQGKHIRVISRKSCRV